jgi:uncharacterized protein YukE
MSWVGADLGQMHDLRARFNQGAEAVRNLSELLEKNLVNTTWRGGAADGFKEVWFSQYRPNLMALEQGLVRAGSCVDAIAGDIDAAANRRVG